jgi:hypothetical protein
MEERRRADTTFRAPEGRYVEHARFEMYSRVRPNPHLCAARISSLLAQRTNASVMTNYFVCNTTDKVCHIYHTVVLISFQAFPSLHSQILVVDFFLLFCSLNCFFLFYFSLFFFSLNLTPPDIHS